MKGKAVTASLIVPGRQTAHYCCSLTNPYTSGQKKLNIHENG